MLAAPLQFCDVEFVILGMEGQEHIHYAMPMRVMGYDYGTYKRQYDDNASKYKNIKGLTEDEFISKMKRTDKFIPVITIVVYYGEKEWEKAINYAREHEVEKSVIMTVAGAANCKMDYNMNEKGGADMCTVFEETWREGKAVGEAKGAKGIVELSYEFGLSEDDILTRLQNKLNISLQKAQEYLAMFGKQSV